MVKRELLQTQFQGVVCKRGHSGIRYMSNRSCVECVKEFNRKRSSTIAGRRYQANWKRENPQTQAEWLAVNRERRMLSVARHRAKKKNTPFSITLEDICIPEICPVFNTPLDWEGKRDDRPSLDRVVSGLGYIKGNVRVISGRANRLKNNMTKSNVLRLLAYIEEGT